jgi:hypothetical protein
MAGVLNVDTLKADSNLKLQIASANVAFIDANGLTIVGNSLNVGGGRIVVTSNNSISTPTVIGANLVTATGTTALGITANGQITTANAPFILTGGQIQFPATQIASGDANCLDDYEEGTWTPVATSGGGSITTYSSNGVYTKIGRTVTIFGSITTTTVGTASGTLNFSGLPFATLNSEQYVGLSREAINTGANHFAVISTSSGYLQSSTGGAITWSNGNSYRFTVTYQAT